MVTCINQITNAQGVDGKQMRHRTQSHAVSGQKEGKGRSSPGRGGRQVMKYARGAGLGRGWHGRGRSATEDSSYGPKRESMDGSAYVPRSFPHGPPGPGFMMGGAPEHMFAMASGLGNMTGMPMSGQPGPALRLGPLPPAGLHTPQQSYGGSAMMGPIGRGVQGRGAGPYGHGTSGPGRGPAQGQYGVPPGYQR